MLGAKPRQNHRKSIQNQTDMQNCSGEYEGLLADLVGAND